MSKTTRQHSRDDGKKNDNGKSTKRAIIIVVI